MGREEPGGVRVVGLAQAFEADERKQEAEAGVLEEVEADGLGCGFEDWVGDVSGRDIARGGQLTD